MYLLQGIHSRTFWWHTQTNFRFYWQKFSFERLFDSSRGVIFTHTYLLRSLWYPWKKNFSAIARRKKNIPFYPARTGINFPHFQLARRSFRFSSQLISQCNFSQLAQIRHEERVFLSSGSVYSCFIDPMCCTFCITLSRLVLSILYFLCGDGVDSRRWLRQPFLC